MNRKTLIPVIGALVLAMVLSACATSTSETASASSGVTPTSAQAEEQPTASEVAPTATQEEEQPTVTPGSPSEETPPLEEEAWVVEEDLWIPVIDALGRHLQAARAYFLEEDFGLAASEMRTAAALIDQELAAEGGSDMISNTDTIVQDLNAMADRLDNVDDARKVELTEVDDLISRAYYMDVEYGWSGGITTHEIALLVAHPSYHFQRAVNWLLDGDSQEAAAELRKGVAFLDLQAARASNETTRTELRQVADELTQMADKLDEGQDVTVEELDQVLANANYLLTRNYYRELLIVDRPTAADDLRRADTFLKTETEQADEGVKATLTAASDRIEALIATLESDGSVATKDLETAFAHTHYALARHYVSLATKMLDENNYELAGRDLSTAAYHTEEGLIWAGHRPVDADAEVIQQVYSVAGRLEDSREEEVPAEDTQNALDSLNTLIGELGGYIGIEE